MEQMNGLNGVKKLNEIDTALEEFEVVDIEEKLDFNQGTWCNCAVVCA